MKILTSLLKELYDGLITFGSMFWVNPMAEVRRER